MNTTAITTEKTNSASLRWARVISNVFHPWVVLVPVLALDAYRTTGNALDCIKWTLVAFLPALVAPLIYAKIRATVLSRNGSRQKISRSLVRNDTKRLLIMACLFGIPSALILYLLNGPTNMLIIILAVTAVMLAISLVNIIYRASFHLAMVTGMLTALWFLLGSVAFISFLLLPILGFSRYRLGEHTPLQIISGLCIGLIISSTVYYTFGLG